MANDIVAMLIGLAGVVFILIRQYTMGRRDARREIENRIQEREHDIAERARRAEGNDPVDSGAALDRLRKRVPKQHSNVRRAQ